MADRKRPRKKAAAKKSAKADVPSRRECATMENHYRMLRTVPGYAEARAASENQASRAASFGVIGRTGCTKIPVVVHVVHKTAAQNISVAQINSQIDVLNDDFRKQNADIGTVPAPFQPLADDARIEFELASTDPSGAATTGITRTSTTVTSFSGNDSVKSSGSGGANPWPSDKYLNIWVCQLSGGLLGYAQFPGGPAATDGVVIRHSAFGTSGTAAAPFDLGRTTTHEVGHWLNLRHIWGDDGTGCSGSDFVADTPNQGGPNYGNPTFPKVSCGNAPDGDMYMNYMDYVDDAAMVMFSAGQVNRMQATLDGLRSSIGTTTPCGGIGPIKKFEPDHVIKKREPDHVIKKREPDFKKREPDVIKKREPDHIKKREPDFKKREPDHVKKHEPEGGKHLVEGGKHEVEVPPMGPGTMDLLEDRIARLESALAQMSHFIEEQQRPDTGRAPLYYEED